MTRLDRMKHGSGIKDRDDRSSGIEIRIADTLTLVVVYYKSKVNLKRVYRNGCRYNERLNAETGGS